MRCSIPGPRGSRSSPGWWSSFYSLAPCMNLWTNTQLAWDYVAYVKAEKRRIRWLKLAFSHKLKFYVLKEAKLPNFLWLLCNFLIKCLQKHYRKSIELWWIKGLPTKLTNVALLVLPRTPLIFISCPVTSRIHPTPMCSWRIPSDTF